MSAADIRTALKRASELKQSGGILSGKDLDAIKSSPEELESYRKDYHNGIFPPSLKRILKKHIHIRNPNDYLTLYVVYRRIFPDLNLKLYTTLLKELAQNPKLKKERRKLKAMLKKSQRGLNKLRDGFIFTAS